MWLISARILPWIISCQMSLRRRPCPCNRCWFWLPYLYPFSATILICFYLLPQISSALTFPAFDMYVDAEAKTSCILSGNETLLLHLYVMCTSESMICVLTRISLAYGRKLTIYNSTNVLLNTSLVNTSSICPPNSLNGFSLRAQYCLLARDRKDLQMWSKYPAGQ